MLQKKGEFMFDNDKSFFTVKSTTISLIVLLTFITFGFWGCPQYGVYSARLGGQAKLQEAESSRQIRVAEAQAKLDSAKKEAEAEVIRAKGQATANLEISKTLTPEVLQYQYIRVMEEQGANGDRTIVYIPTNPASGLPINLPAPEANRLK
jgi:hypothetical protein